VKASGRRISHSLEVDVEDVEGKDVEDEVVEGEAVEDKAVEDEDAEDEVVGVVVSVFSVKEFKQQESSEPQQ
jgi:hypothetical protein